MKQVIISGASAGIGAATAARFLEAGWAVLNLSRRPSPVSGVTNLAVDLGAVDFMEAAEAPLLAAAAAADRLCLIHNAARFDKDSLTTLTAEGLRAVLEINVVAPQRLNALLVPEMKPGSSVLYVGSTLSEKAITGAFSYVTTKHAQVGMMRATSQDLRGTGVHTAAICPGFTDTEMLRKNLQGDPEITAAVAGMSGFNRLIEPDEIARLLYFAANNPVIGGAVLHAHLAQLES